MKYQLPEKLMKLRRHYHVSQQQVASFCGVELMEYMSWENGRVVPDEAHLAKLGELFHLTLEEMKMESLDIPLHEVIEEITQMEKTVEMPVAMDTDRPVKLDTTEEKSGMNLLKNWKVWVIAGCVVLLGLMLSLLKEPEIQLTGIEVSNRLSENERLVCGDDFVLVLNANGTVSASGNNEEGQLNVSSWKNITQLTAGEAFSAGLTEDGMVVATGANRYGQIETEELTGIIEISAGAEHLAALRADGTVICLGDNSEGQCEVSSWSNIVAISSSKSSTLGLTEDGTVMFAGKIDVDQEEIQSWTKIKKLINGQSHVLALTENKTVYCTASSSYPVCQTTENWKDVLSIKTAGNHVVALLSNGRLVASGDNSSLQGNVSQFKNVISISAGKEFTVALTRDSQLIGTGDNQHHLFEMIEEEKNIPLSKVEELNVLISDKVTISWKQVADANYYQIQILELGYSANVADLSVSLDLNRFVDGTEYTVSVTALTMNGSREPSAAQEIRFMFTAPQIEPEPTPSIVPTESPEPSETPEGTETPEPSETPEVTETPEPSETPEASEEPEMTPDATENPEPSETPESEETTESQE